MSYALDIVVGFVAESSDDPVDLPGGKENSYWLGMNFSYQYSAAHLISLFYGKRGGGNACTSGICYEIYRLKV